MTRVIKWDQGRSLMIEGYFTGASQKGLKFQKISIIPREVVKFLIMILIVFEKFINGCVEVL